MFAMKANERRRQLNRMVRHFCLTLSVCRPLSPLRRLVKGVFSTRRNRSCCKLCVVLSMSFQPAETNIWGHEIRCNIESHDEIAVSKASCLSSGYFHPKSVEGLGSNVCVNRQPSVPHRRRSCYPCQHAVVSSQQGLSTNHSAWS